MNQSTPAPLVGEANSLTALAGYTRSFPEADESMLAAHLALASISNALTQGIEARIQQAGFDLSRPRYTIVRMLYLSPEQALPQSEIAQAMRVSGANVTQLIDALAADGWVERVVNPSDRRVTYAQLTPAGKLRCARLVPLVVDYMLDSVSPLTDEERATVLALVQKVHAHIRPEG